MKTNQLRLSIRGINTSPTNLPCQRDKLTYVVSKPPSQDTKINALFACSARTKQGIGVRSSAWLAPMRIGPKTAINRTSTHQTEKAKLQKKNHKIAYHRGRTTRLQQPFLRTEFLAIQLDESWMIRDMKPSEKGLISPSFRPQRSISCAIA